MQHPPPRSPAREWIPPHVAWPAFVILLLAMSVGLGVTAVVAANSDGGARLVEEYRTAR